MKSPTLHKSTLKACGFFLIAVVCLAVLIFCYYKDAVQLQETGKASGGLVVVACAAGTACIIFCWKVCGILIESSDWKNL